MSMLAEPKRKQKWSLNPRGKTWAQDTNKFGHKMLEKMGWSHGKGLGANENGMLEHIKVSHKNDSTGIGYKESDNQWTEHESNFSALLEALGGGDQAAVEIKLNSLEEKSEKSRARVHYKKFTRGKDLSKYSEKDLANIFGKKTLKKVKKEQMEESVKETDAEETEKSGLFSHGGLISDYFKKKFPSLGKVNGYVVGNNGVLQKADDLESKGELRPSFGFGFKQEDETLEEEGNRTFVVSKEDSKVTSIFTPFIYENNSEDGSKKKKNRKKRDLDGDSGAVEDTPTKKKKLEASDVHVDTPVKKRKGKLQGELQTGLSNPGFQPLYTPVKLEKHILEPIEESPTELTLNDTVGQVADSFEVHVQINNESTPVKLKNNNGSEDGSVKNKKKNRGAVLSDNIEDMDVSYQNQEGLDQSINGVKQKKRKYLEETSGNISQLSPPEDSSSTNTSLKKDKKRKKDKIKSCESDDCEQSTTSKKNKLTTCDSQEGLDNPFFNMSIENEESFVLQTENPFELKIKDKKKKKKGKDQRENCGLENPVFNTEDRVNSQCVTNEAFEVKRKDKSKKRKKESGGPNNSDEATTCGLKNPVFNAEDSVNPQDVTNEAFEVKRKDKSKKRKKESGGINNPDETTTCGLKNPVFNAEDSVNSQEVTNEAFEVKRKDKSKKRKKESGGINNPDETTTCGLKNPVFNAEDSVNSQDIANEAFEVKRKEKSKKKKAKEEKGLDNPALNLNDTLEESCDLMLNVVSTPVVLRKELRTPDESLRIQKVSGVTRRKSVRFSDVTRERIIPNKEEMEQDTLDDSRDIVEVEGKLNDSSELTYIDKFIEKKKAKKRKKGLDNTGFDKQANSLEENITSISKTLDSYQAEIENDMNEAKLKSVELEDIMVGEVGNPNGVNEMLPDGTVKLKFKNAKFSKSARFIEGLTGAKKSYKHLIKGDIVMKFQEANLHEIEGYAVKAS